eukprot:TRINITY_DN68456_c0_g1_i1.p1 TRINITY_DN68456_c0_g1~~TRINITY_DN68456_c0_g1_i1.p1  ORF type:complete len:399 (+),score=43.25 TRINITY_DN68456_c0_g1_i1:27-1223(+)
MRTAVRWGLACAAAVTGTYNGVKIHANTSSHPLVCNGVADAVGNTPMIRIASLSDATGCEILAKAEHLNPGGSIKDRPALFMIREALQGGKIKPNSGTVVEATAGNTGVGLAVQAKQFGLPCIFTLPQKTSTEKVEGLQHLGASTIVCPMGPTTDPNTFQPRAQAIADELGEGNACFINQFENLANGEAHYQTTGKEIWEQTQGKIDAFVYAPGTGGTISGTSRRLKEYSPAVQVWCAQSRGSGIIPDESAVDTDFIKYRKMTPEEDKQLAGPSVLEGIGSGRVYKNFENAKIDGEMRFSGDGGAVAMCRFMNKREGLNIGGSAGLNLLAAYHLAKRMGPGNTIVTIICDGGDKYRSTIYCDDFLKTKNVPIMQCDKLADFVDSGDSVPFRWTMKSQK